MDISTETGTVRERIKEQILVMGEQRSRKRKKKSFWKVIPGQLRSSVFCLCSKSPLLRGKLWGIKVLNLPFDEVLEKSERPTVIKLSLRLLTGHKSGQNGASTNREEFLRRLQRKGGKGSTAPESKIAGRLKKTSRRIKMIVHYSKTIANR